MARPREHVFGSVLWCCVEDRLHMEIAALRSVVRNSMSCIDTDLPCDIKIIAHLFPPVDFSFYAIFCLLPLMFVLSVSVFFLKQSLSF